MTKRKNKPLGKPTNAKIRHVADLVGGVNELSEILKTGVVNIYQKIRSTGSNFTDSEWDIIAKATDGKCTEKWYRSGKLATGKLSVILDKFECEVLNQGNAEEYYKAWGFIPGRKVNIKCHYSDEAKTEIESCERYQFTSM